MERRLSHENQEMKQLYAEFYGKPLSELAEKCCTRPIWTGAAT